MDEVNLYRYIHEHFNMLVNIEKNMFPVMRTIPDDQEMSDTRKYYFKKVGGIIGVLIRLATDLQFKLQTNDKTEIYLSKYQQLLEPLQIYLTAKEKFYPAFLSDKLSEFNQFLQLLQDFKTYMQEIHFIDLEIQKANLVLNEFFLRQAYQLIVNARNTAKETLTTLDNDAINSQYRTLNVVDIIDAHIENERANSDNKKIDVRRKYDLNNCFALGFKSDITRAMGNLINNAIKYNDTLHRYQVWITIEIYRLNDKIKIEIENWGPGIDPDELQDELIFMEGYRGRQAEKRRISGTGIGLYDARKGIEKSGGNLEIISERARHDSKQYITTAIVTLNAMPLNT